MAPARVPLRLARPLHPSRHSTSLPQLLFRVQPPFTSHFSRAFIRRLTGLSRLANFPAETSLPSFCGDDGLASIASLVAQRAPVPAPASRKLCDLGTGEQMEVLAFRAAAGRVECFEKIVQRLSFELQQMETGVSDVRVMHPACGEATFVVTLLSRAEAERFGAELKPRMLAALQPVSDGGQPLYANCGSLMPQAHSLGSLLTTLKERLAGVHCVAEHDVRGIGREIARWFPRPEEYAPYVSVDPADPRAYTRNVMLSTPEMEVLLMCWPAGARSTIHCHDESSCWVCAVEGEVHEVQFDLPLLDKKFERQAREDPRGNITGKCGPLRAVQVRSLGCGVADATGDIPGKQTYANNEIGIHRIENRSGHPAITMHVYAPRLRRMKIFRDTGDVAVVTVTSDEGDATVEKVGDWDSGEILDVASWNAH